MKIIKTTRGIDKRTFKRYKVLKIYKCKISAKAFIAKSRTPKTQAYLKANLMTLSVRDTTFGVNLTYLHLRVER